jgi:hypothetical protein
MSRRSCANFSAPAFDRVREAGIYLEACTSDPLAAPDTSSARWKCLLYRGKICRRVQRLLGGTSFQAEFLAQREQTDGLLQPPRLRFLLLGGIDPSDVHPPG